MVAMQLNGIGGQFCTVDPRTQAPKRSNSTEENLPTLSKAFGCPLRSTGGMGPAVSSSLNVAVLPQPHAPRQLSSWLLTPCPLFNGINVVDGRYEQRTI